MSKLRFSFEKLGRARYLSHLDLMRTFQRAFIRAGLKLKHSEGFNPHPQMSIVLPLRLGCESVCEMLDADVLDPRDDMVQAINSTLPEGLRVISAAEPVMKPGAIKYTRSSIRLFYADGTDRSEQAAEILSGSPLMILKKTKRGQEMLDIAPHIRLLGARDNLLELRLSAFEPTVNPEEAAQLLGAEHFQCRRLEIYTEKMEKFR